MWTPGDLWSCVACGCHGIAASLTWCPNCGRSADMSVVIHQADNSDDPGAEPAADEAVEAVEPAVKPKSGKGRM